MFSESQVGSAQLHLLFCLFSRRKSDNFLSGQAALADLKEFFPDVWMEKIMFCPLKQGEQESLHKRERKS